MNTITYRSLFGLWPAYTTYDLSAASRSILVVKPESQPLKALFEINIYLCLTIRKVCAAADHQAIVPTIDLWQVDSNPLAGLEKTYRGKW